jgi:hypothetical protein
MMRGIAYNGKGYWTGTIRRAFTKVLDFVALAMAGAPEFLSMHAVTATMFD